jgi:integrase
LYVDDIREVAGIWCFSFNNDGLKKLKNLSSIRSIPIHSKLVELGFLNFVSHRRERNDLRIFPELPWKELDGYQRNASKWFSDYRRRCGIVSTKKTFHSFRHTVSNHLKQRGCMAEQVSSLLGHATETITFDRYGKEYSPELMRRVVEQIDYGISFSSILRADVNPYVQCPTNMDG